MTFVPGFDAKVPAEAGVVSSVVEVNLFQAHVGAEGDVDDDGE